MQMDTFSEKHKMFGHKIKKKKKKIHRVRNVLLIETDNYCKQMNCLHFKFFRFKVNMHNVSRNVSDSAA